MHYFNMLDTTYGQDATYLQLFVWKKFFQARFLYFVRNDNQGKKENFLVSVYYIYLHLDWPLENEQLWNSSQFFYIFS